MTQCEECGFGDGVHDTPCVLDPRQKKPAMIEVEVTIGWTRSEVVDGQLVYSSFGDGYKPGASQHIETITVDFEPATDRSMDWNVLAIAEAAFGATNNPSDVTGLEAQIRNAIEATGYRGQGAHYSLSTGDTVTVNEITLACASFGWERVTIPIG